MMNKNCPMPQQRGCTTLPQGNTAPNTAPTQASRPCNTQTSCRQMTQMQLINHINEVSFAAIDSMLYLDTHPYDCEALEYNQKMMAMRDEALAEYSHRFGPLTIDCTIDYDSHCWAWIQQPFPWETTSKGGCR